VRVTFHTYLFSLSFSCSVHHPDLHSFPTRRSSDLPSPAVDRAGLQYIRHCSWAFCNRSLLLRFATKVVAACHPCPECGAAAGNRSEEHTSELQSRSDLVCRLLLEKKKNTKKSIFSN